MNSLLGLSRASSLPSQPKTPSRGVRRSSSITPVVCAAQNPRERHAESDFDSAFSRIKPGRGSSIDSQGTLDIKVPSPRRPRPELPQPVPVVHSASFLVEASRRQLGIQDQEEEDRARNGKGASSSEPEVFTGNAVQWALKRADGALKEVEQQPPELAREAYRLANSPAGRMVGYAASEAAKATVVVGKEVFKAAMPLAKGAAGVALSAALEVIKTTDKAVKEASATSAKKEGGNAKQDSENGAGDAARKKD